MKNKKVGIVSCYFKHNYGSMLQAYATKKVLDNNAIPNETIAIEDNTDFSNGKKKYYISQIANIKFVKGKLGMVKLKVDKKVNKTLGKNIAIRTNKYNEFKREYNLSKSCKTYSDLTKMAMDKYSDVIVGSDQLWLPVNVVANYYTLNWVPDEINKVSYATSFGFSSVPQKYNKMYIKFLKRINHLSTREQSGVEIIKDVADLDAKLVCDPTLLLTKDEWKAEMTSGRKYKEKYILCYFLGNNIEHRKFAERLRKETGFKIVSLNHADEYVEYSDKFCDFAPYDIGPREWINLIANAEYVLTDSFHGTVFSLIFNKKFYDFRRYKANSKISTNSRLDSLLEIAGVPKERILTGNEEVKEVLEYKIDYRKVNKNLKLFREESKKWLFDSLTWKKQIEEKHIEINDKELCSGCSACASVCPVNAIQMIEDEEGFKYPIVDKEKCINCSACKRVCPILNRKSEERFKQVGYVLNNKNLKVRNESTSGGFFTAVAEYVLSKNGKVYGAAFDSKFEVKHVSVDKVKDIKKFRSSKYVQSDINDTYREVKKDLLEERWVCFSGTPCQIEGLKSFLNKDYEKLILVDVVCRAVPSPKLLRKYLIYMKETKLGNEKLKEVIFRDKAKYGYKYTTMTLKTKNHTYRQGVDTDPYLRAFFNEYSIRPSCFNCSFRKRYRVSDFTMWDCFNIEDFDKKLDDNKGTTRILIQSEKGKQIFEKIKDNFYYREIDSDVLVKGSREIVKSVRVNNTREEFFKDMNSLKTEELFRKYFPNNFRVRIERNARKALVRTGVYKKVKKVAKKMLGK